MLARPRDSSAGRGLGVRAEMGRVAWPVVTRAPALPAREGADLALRRAAWLTARRHAAGRRDHLLAPRAARLHRSAAASPWQGRAGLLRRVRPAQARRAGSALAALPGPTTAAGAAATAIAAR